MIERPILFSGPLVVAILDGLKDVTRRLIPMQDPSRARLLSCVDGVAMFGDTIPDDPVPLRVQCRYGKPGDRLWIRESFFCNLKDHPPDDYPIIHYRADMSEHYTDGRTVSPRYGTSVHRGPWKPSIHMPRWASRILLEVVSVRVERLQDITAAEVRREGIELPVSTHDCPPGKGHPCVRVLDNPFEKRGPLSDWTEDDFWRCEFACTWEAINGKRSPWRRNDWVWRVEFRRLA